HFSPINGRVSITNRYPSKATDKIMQIDSEEKVIHANISESDINLLKINQNYIFVYYFQSTFKSNFFLAICF
ncbi:hypothetical protein LCC45_19445, partial [Staphylococcus aureus]|nr:hypothetical protein [Staphylococcus aureus]